MCKIRRRFLQLLY